MRSRCGQQHAATLAKSDAHCTVALRKRAKDYFVAVFNECALLTVGK
jgi:hypothetical protein